MRLEPTLRGKLALSVLKEALWGSRKSPALRTDPGSNPASNIDSVTCVNHSPSGSSPFQLLHLKWDHSAPPYRVVTSTLKWNV